MTHSAGFIPRSEAEEKYGRSRSSFIRDINRGFATGDVEFLGNFYVFLNDGTRIEGSEATKDRLRTSGHLQPEWYVRESFVESRYWQKKSPRKPTRNTTTSTKPTSDGGGDSSSLKTYSVEYVELLQNQIEDLKKDKENYRLMVEGYNKTLDEQGKLQSQLHTLLQDLQKRPLPLQEPLATAESEASPVVIPIEAVDAVEVPPTSQRPKKMVKKAVKKPRKRKKASSPQRYRWHDIPTIKKLFNRRTS